MASIPFIHLIIKYCTHSIPERQAEYDYCLTQNLANPFICEIHNLCDPNISTPKVFTRHPKYHEQEMSGKYLKFSDAFAYANKHLHGKVVCIANLDTFLSHQSAWDTSINLLRHGVVLALSRTEFDGKSTPFKDPDFQSLYYAHSQDAWIFESPFIVQDTDFFLGTLGCDNALAERIQRSGRIPLNSPNSYQLLHFDQARRKTARNQASIHAIETFGQERIKPEESGQLLLPDFDCVQSLDVLAGILGLSALERYQIACLIMSSKIKVRNP